MAPRLRHACLPLQSNPGPADARREIRQQPLRVSFSTPAPPPATTAPPRCHRWTGNCGSQCWSGVSTIQDKELPANMQRHSLILAKFQTPLDGAYCRFPQTIYSTLQQIFFCSEPKWIIWSSTTFEAMGELRLLANSGCVYEVTTKHGFHGWGKSCGFLMM